MNTKITALTLAAASAFAFTPKPASAGHDTAGAVIAGAVIGGLIGAAVSNSNDGYGHTQVYTNVGYCPPPAPVYVDDGYWTTASVNVWVAPVWVVERDYYGRSCRRYVAGHYEYRNERRWVAHHGSGYRGHEVANGYGHGNNYNNNRGYNNGHNNDRNNGHQNDRDNRRNRR